MHLVLLTWISTGLPAVGVSDRPLYGYLYQPAYCLDEQPRPPAEVYQAQAGDLLFFNDHSWIWQLGFYLALSNQPMHAGIVVQMPDGQLSALEAGYDDRTWVDIVPLPARLREFKGAVWVRRRVQPLTAEESARLTEFALRVNQGRFAVLRLIAQVTPFRSRGPLKTFFLGKPRGLRRSYFCSECVLEACVYAGLLDKETTRPAATYPRDMFFDRSPNLYLNKHLKLAPAWEIPALWTDCPVLLVGPAPWHPVPQP
jgi:hypothetical protein